MDISSVIGNTSDQTGGVWLPFPDVAGVQFLVVYSRKGEPKHYYQKKFNKARRVSAMGDVPVEKLNDISMNMLVYHVVKDWKGLTQKDPADDTKTVEFPYSKENCRMLLTQAVPILDWLTTACSNIENFGGKLDEASDDEEGDTPQGKMKSVPPVAD